MNDKKKAFYFFFSWLDAMIDMTEDEQLQYLKGIIHIAQHGTMPEDALRIVRVPLQLVYNDIQMCQEKYEEISKKRAEAGRKHTGNQYTRLEQNGTNETKRNKWNYKDKDKDKDKEKETSLKRGKEKDNTLPQRKDKFWLELQEYIPIYGQEMIESFFNYWAETNRSQTLMRMEKETTWELKRRLITWNKREYGDKKNRPTNRQGASASDAMQLFIDKMQG